MVLVNVMVYITAMVTVVVMVMVLVLVLVRVLSIVLIMIMVKPIYHFEFRKQLFSVVAVEPVIAKGGRPCAGMYVLSSALVSALYQQYNCFHIIKDLSP